MTYNDALEYLLEQLPMFQRIGAAAYRTDLINITQLCNILGNPQQYVKCIHVAGTNGKGSVTHLIASILQEQGYKVGVFVSPHYKDYRERIKINGRYITRPFVTKFVERNLHRFKGINASFFEISTAMAFEYFKQQKVDFAVIETGMGGRLDSTNIITPLLSVITNISYDHTRFLGDTLPKIAGEKAGIIKPHVPVLIGETQKETRRVFIAKGKEVNAPVFFADKMHLTLPKATTLKAAYQQKNITTALGAAIILGVIGIPLAAQAIRNGIKNVAANTAFTGRWMVIGKKPLIVFDSAHNQAGLAEVKKEIAAVKYKQLHVVFGTVADKDISTTLPLLPKNAVYYFCKANIPRGMDANELQQQAMQFKLKGTAFKSVAAAYKAALANAGKNDFILVTGSVFVVAEVI